VAPVSKGIAGYRFDAQDDTQLTIYPGDEVDILQKVRRLPNARGVMLTNGSNALHFVGQDDDGWWLVELRNKRGYVPGSYLIERPIEEPKPEPKKKRSAFKSKPKRKPGLCTQCSTQNPAEARFCRSCGNNLMA
jgi:ribosomal protein L40E